MGPELGNGRMYRPRARNTRLNAYVAGLSVPTPWARLNVAVDCPCACRSECQQRDLYEILPRINLSSSKRLRRRATGYCARVAFPGHLQALAACAHGGFRGLDARSYALSHGMRSAPR